MQPTHKSVYKTIRVDKVKDSEPVFETVKDGNACGVPGLYSSADWDAVDCAECLATKQGLSERIGYSAEP